MYNSRPKVVLEKKVIHKSKEKSCGYYLRIVFFFSSLIQSLIIVSLVLFLVYGQPGKTPEEKRVEELEKGFSMLSQDNTKLRKEKTNLTISLKTKTTELAKLSVEFEAAKSNNTKLVHALSQCNASKPPIPRISPVQCPAVSTSTGHLKSLQTALDHQRSLYVILQSNFTQTVHSLKIDLERVAKEKSKHEMAAMQLKQEKEDLASELQIYTKKCREEFESSLQGIQTVTSTFLTKIDNIFPQSFTFLLTCTKQKEQMERIHNNCTNLSRQVENKFQTYLDIVGEKVSELLAKSSRLEVENRRLTLNLQQCSQSRTQENEQCKKLLVEAQETQDRLMEPLLQAQKQLMDEKRMMQTLCAPKSSQPLQPSMPRSSGHDPSVSASGHQTRTGMSSSGTSVVG